MLRLFLLHALTDQPLDFSLLRLSIQNVQNVAIRFQVQLKADKSGIFPVIAFLRGLLFPFYDIPLLSGDGAGFPAPFPLLLGT